MLNCAKRRNAQGDRRGRDGSGQSNIARIAVEAAQERIGAALAAEGLIDAQEILAEARRRGWSEGNEITDTGFEVGT